MLRRRRNLSLICLMGEGSRVPSRQHPLVFVWSWQMYVCPKREISRWCRFSDLRISSPEKLKSELANKMKFPPALAPYPEIFISYDLNKRGVAPAKTKLCDGLCSRSQRGQDGMSLITSKLFPATALNGQEDDCLNRPSVGLRWIGKFRRVSLARNYLQLSQTRRLRSSSR